MSIDLNKFKKDAIRTESTITNIIVDDEAITNVLDLYIAAGNMLDQIKKHVFYGSEYDLEKYSKTIQGEITTAQYALANLSGFAAAPNDRIERVFGKSTLDPRIFHALIGIATESSELIEALKAYIRNGEIDLPNVGEENGDIAWYQAIFYDAAGLEWEDSLTAVIDKLQLRYPEKFNQLDAEERNLVAEREILERQVK